MPRERGRGSNAKDVTHNNKALRIVDGVVGSGGTNSFSSVLGSSAGISTDGHVLSTAELASHGHSASGLTASSSGAHTHGVPANTTSGVANAAQRAGSVSLSFDTDSAGLHTHSISGSISSTGNDVAHSHTLSVDIEFVDVILGIRD